MAKFRSSTSEFLRSELRSSAALAGHLAFDCAVIPKLKQLGSELSAGIDVVGRIRSAGSPAWDDFTGHIETSPKATSRVRITVRITVRETGDARRVLFHAHAMLDERLDTSGYSGFEVRGSLEDTPAGKVCQPSGFVVLHNVWDWLEM